MHFNLISNDPKSNARAGVLHTDHGPIETPIFMPVGTVGTVKACHIRDIRDEVKAAGYMIVDTPEGAKLKKI